MFQRRSIFQRRRTAGYTPREEFPRMCVRQSERNRERMGTLLYTCACVRGDKQTCCGVNVGLSVCVCEYVRVWMFSFLSFFFTYGNADTEGLMIGQYLFIYS